MKKDSILSNKINQALFFIESARDAVEHHHNFNLAEVWIEEYFTLELKKDKVIQRNLIAALKNRDAFLLGAVIDAEIERLRGQKIKKLQEYLLKKFTQSLLLRPNFGQEDHAQK